MADGPAESGRAEDAAAAGLEDGAAMSASTAAAAAGSDPASDEEEDEDEEGGDEEPQLRYTRLTGNLSTLYRNGDATSTFTVAGDKMVVGSHNGNIHVLSIPSLQTLRLYHAHSASVTAVSISPFPPSPSMKGNLEVVGRLSTGPQSTPTKAASSTSTSAGSPRTPKQHAVPATLSNSIYIATSSVDGHVCVSSLVDPKDVTLRNFARPVQAVALSPDFKNDRSYLSGGLAGSLILTTGGRPGVSANANTSSATAAAAGWLGSIGLAANTGKDTVLHSGEGGINTIKWSRSGKFVMWVNEQGIKVMRSNLHLESADSDSSWKRIAHVAKPPRRIWDEMAGVWKARAEWIDDNSLALDEERGHATSNGTAGVASKKAMTSPSHPNSGGSTSRDKRGRLERLVVGWGDTAWVIHVQPGGSSSGTGIKNRTLGSVNIVHILRFDDCNISGISLFTTSSLVVLAYRMRDDNDDHKLPSISPQNAPQRGRQHRHNGLSPELRLIDLQTKDEIDVDALSMSRFESLSVADYHLSTLFVPPYAQDTSVQRGAFEAISEGLWDAGRSAGRIFSSGASTGSQPNSGDNVKLNASQRSASDVKTSITLKRSEEPFKTLSTVGLKVFIHSPYDCVVAVKRDLSDHLTWLLQHEKFEDAWSLVERYPEVITTVPETQSGSAPSTPAKGQQSLAEFFADDAISQSTLSGSQALNSAVEKEKRRIGDLWIQQLVAAGDWTSAGRVAGKVLGTSPRWEHWIWIFAQARRFDDITPYIPSAKLQPPLPSLVYEVILGHYIGHDRVQLKRLLGEWDPHMFDLSSVTSAIEEKLKAGDVTETSVEDGQRGRDWRILLEMLAKLYAADERPREALKCYIRLQNADAAMAIIRDYHLIGALADDIPDFVTLRVSKEQLEAAHLDELEEACMEAIQLLVDEAFQGSVHTSLVVRQLELKGQRFRPFLFLYLRALWKGQGSEDVSARRKDRVASEGRLLVEEFGDLAVEMFAEYDRSLLMEFLRSSQSYSYERASAVCEKRNYIPELVHLLAKTGQTKRALFLIIDKLADVSQAISFAKEQDDPDLWNDLLDYSMDKPGFIKGLLEEVGTAFDPVALIRRIPEGLEIEGLRDGIGRMVREYEIQFSISEGVAKVLKGEVAMGMDVLRAGQKKGVKFAVLREPADALAEDEAMPGTVAKDGDTKSTIREAGAHKTKKRLRPGRCAGCGKSYVGRGDETEILVGFACGHVHHLSCLISAATKAHMNTDADMDAATATAQRLQALLSRPHAGTESGSAERSVGAKVAHAHALRNIVRAGCPVCGTVPSDD